MNNPSHKLSAPTRQAEICVSVDCGDRQTKKADSGVLKSQNRPMTKSRYLAYPRTVDIQRFLKLGKYSASVASFLG